MNGHEWDDDIEPPKYRGRPSRLRYSLAALMAFVVVANVLFAVIHQWGDTLGERARRRTEQLSELRWVPASEVLPLLCACGSCLLGILVAILVNRLGRNGYVVFAGITCLSLLAFVYALNVEIRPLSATPMQELRLDQVLYAASLPAAFTLPASAFVGWYLSIFKEDH